MKRLDLVQLSIVITGICSAFFFVEMLPSFFYYMFDWFSGGLRGGYAMEGLIPTILLLAIYLIFALLSISNSKQLASWIGNKANLNADINFALNAKDLLFVLLIVLGIYGLIKDLPQLLVNLYNYFKESPHTLYDINPAKPGTHQLFVQLAKLALYCVLLIYANTFSQFFADRIKNTTEPHDEKEDKLS